ncbi:MAG: MBL fold metallo-hydrolase, partial [Gammaproteobacteria bacterium]|nr:MBL fold metallo-hydrolase [Gammaproteobacteria bacterium]
TVQEAQAAMHRFRGMVYGEKKEIIPGVTIRFRDAGHILGSSIVEVWLDEGSESRKLVFSGDLGHRGAAILRDPEAIKQADLVVMESTYGDRLHRSWEETWEEMAQIFIQARKGHGNILIPAFTVGRTQELLYTFARHYEAWDMGRWHIFLDSPMAIAATDVYARHSDLYDIEATKHAHEQGGLFSLPNLTFSRTALQSMGINQISDGAIIIAGSGMCSGGRIKHHLKHNIWRNDCQLIIVGFQARGTLGRALVDGTDSIRLWGETMRVAAKIHTVGGLSAHADSDGLVNWHGHFEGNPLTALVHGEPEAMDALEERLISETHARVITPGQGEQLDLLAL